MLSAIFPLAAYIDERFERRNRELYVGQLSKERLFLMSLEWTESQLAAYQARLAEINYKLDKWRAYNVSNSNK